MPKLVLSICIMLIGSATVYAQSYQIDAPIHTRFGNLTSSNEGILMLNGHGIAPKDSGQGQNFQFFVASYQIGNNDVVLLNASGNGCPGKYIYVTVSATAATVTPPFGTCMETDLEDANKPAQSGTSISFSMQKVGSTGSVTYIYRNGKVVEK